MGKYQATGCKSYLKPTTYGLRLATDYGQICSERILPWLVMLIKPCQGIIAVLMYNGDVKRRSQQYGGMNHGAAIFSGYRPGQ
jgi:hypothetical protein